MKAAHFMVGLTAVVCAAVASPPAVPTPMRLTLAAEFKDQFQYRPPPAAAPGVSALPATADEPVVRMKPFIVSAGTEFRELRSIFLRQERKFSDNEFTVLNGGPLWTSQGRIFLSEFELKLRLHGHSGADIFRFSFSW